MPAVDFLSRGNPSGSADSTRFPREEPIYGYYDCRRRQLYWPIGRLLPHNQRHQQGIVAVDAGRDRSIMGGSVFWGPVGPSARGLAARYSAGPPA